MTVYLEDAMGDDLTIVNAARVSFAKRSGWAKQCGNCKNIDWPTTYFVSKCPSCGSYDAGTKPVLRDSDIGLIEYLMKNRHGTPFEMVVFRFRVNVPIGVAREWQRHRIGSFNEVSTRYHEMEPDFYTPNLDAVRTQVGKPGSYQMETMLASDAVPAVRMMEDAYGYAYGTYQNLLKLGVAKELARNVLPLGLLTEFIWCVNLRSLFNFMALRSDSRALYEIRIQSEIIEYLVKQIVPYSFAAWEKFGRLVP